MEMDLPNGLMQATLEGPASLGKSAGTEHGVLAHWRPGEVKEVRMRGWLLRGAFGALLVLLFPSGADGSEVYVLRFRTDVIYFQPPCLAVGWRDELLFRNVTNGDLTVRNLATTAGAANPPGQLLIPAGRTVSTLSEGSIERLGGDPFGFELLVNRLDVPDGIVLASRADIYGPPAICPSNPTPTIHEFGNLPLPAFRSLVAANQPQIHLPVDLGIHRRHTNVIIYNAGTVDANARIELHAGCNDSLLHALSVRITPGSVTEVGGITDDPLTVTCLSAGLTSNFTRYIVVTVDQPSFSHVLTVSDEFQTPTIGVTSP